MKTRQMMRRWRVRGLVFGLLALAGCETYSPAQSSIENETVWINLTHEVAFRGDQVDLSALERRRLDAFLAEIAAVATDSLTVDPGVADDAGAQARALAVVDHLRARVPTAQPRVRRIGLEAGRDLRVVVGRYLVVPPQCPNWSKPSNRDPRNLATANLGCSINANLALMIADPADLVRGRVTTPALGAMGTAAIERYLNDEVKELVLEQTSDIDD